MPELFNGEPSIDDTSHVAEEGSGEKSEDSKSSKSNEEALSANAVLVSEKAEIKLIRIQGIEPELEIPFSWVVNNLINPEHFLHICVYLKVAEPIVMV